VLAANMRGDIMLMDIETGRRQWVFETGSPVSGSPALANGRIIIGTNDGTVWCFGN
jgi:eukaryotic-like serine/threonine-protein kinase